MKRLSFLITFSVFIAATIFVVSCTKDISDERLDPKLSTSQVYDVTSDAATVVGFIVASGDGFTEKGVCYHTDTLPTINDNKVVYSETDASATFIVTISGLDYATKYHVRAYASSASGTLYGESYTFTTLPVLASITTAPVTDIQGTTATTGGEVTNEGGADVTAKGVCYSENPNPTLNDNYTNDGSGIGAFTSNLTGLSGLTKYYVRAYAKNSAGTAYGPQIEFTTLVSIRTWYVPGDYVEASYPGSGLANWSPDKSPMIMSSEANPNNLEGYVHMANASNQWKLTDGPSWDVNYGSSNGSTLEPGGANIVSPAGYYKITANATELTYTAVPLVWGVIGSATPGGWGSETQLAYDPQSRTWRGGVSMTVAEFKFRAHDWAYNYGAPAGSNLLVHDGPNIAISVAADYYFILDLSTPHNYTYSANRWGLIGSATPGGWSSDQDMTWDAVNGCMSVTVDLVVGEIKFRANDDWAVNLGGDVNNLTAGGANIPIVEAGSYTIKLFLVGDAGTCTIVKN